MERENIFSAKYGRQPGLGTCQVIKRKKYDTETASLLWSAEYDDDERLECHGVALFQKQSGEYFKYDTRFWKYDSKEWAKPVLSPLTEEEAKDLTEKYAADEYIDIFGDVEE